MVSAYFTNYPTDNHESICHSEDNMQNMDKYSSQLPSEMWLYPKLNWKNNNTGSYLTGYTVYRAAFKYLYI